MALWGDIGAGLRAAAKKAAAALEKQAADSAAHVVKDVADDPRVQKALGAAGEKLSKPTSQKITPMIWLAGAGILIVVLLVFIFARKKSA